MSGTKHEITERRPAESEAGPDHAARQNRRALMRLVVIVAALAGVIAYRWAFGPPALEDVGGMTRDQVRTELGEPRAIEKIAYDLPTPEDLGIDGLEYRAVITTMIRGIKAEAWVYDGAAPLMGAYRVVFNVRGNVIAVD